MPEKMGALYYVIAAAAVVVAAIAAFFLGITYRKKVSEREISSAEEEATRIINEAIKTAENTNALVVYFISDIIKPPITQEG